MTAPNLIPRPEFVRLSGMPPEPETCVLVSLSLSEHLSEGVRLARKGETVRIWHSSRNGKSGLLELILTRGVDGTVPKRHYVGDWVLLPSLPTGRGGNERNDPRPFLLPT